MNVKELITKLKTTGLNVFYTQADNGTLPPYLVVNDYTERYITADNQIDEIIISVQIDYYTVEPYDTNKDVILELLNSLEIIPEYSRYYLNDEKVYQHIFDIEIT